MNELLVGVNPPKHTCDMITKSEIRMRCDALIIALVGKDLAFEWWLSKNKAFDDKTPEAMYQEDPNRVYNYLMDYTAK